MNYAPAHLHRASSHAPVGHMQDRHPVQSVQHTIAKQLSCIPLITTACPGQASELSRHKMLGQQVLLHCRQDKCNQSPAHNLNQSAHNHHPATAHLSCSHPGKGGPLTVTSYLLPG
jgi:hypothetical protein